MRFLIYFILCNLNVVWGDPSTLQSGLDVGTELKCESDDRSVVFSLKVLSEMRNPYSSQMRFSRGILKGSQANPPVNFETEFPVVELFHNSYTALIRTPLPRTRYELEIRYEPQSVSARFSAALTTDLRMACANCDDAVIMKCRF